MLPYGPEGTMGRQGKDKDGEPRKLAGIQTVRPPKLKFDKVKETKDYTEFMVTTFKDAETDAEPPGVPAQSAQSLFPLHTPQSSIAALPPLQLPQSSNSAVPPHSPLQSNTQEGSPAGPQ